MSSFRDKYLKYKAKYLNLKEIVGGSKESRKKAADEALITGVLLDTTFGEKMKLNPILIADNEFTGKKRAISEKLTSAIIPESVVTIGDSAFSYNNI